MARTRTCLALVACGLVSAHVVLITAPQRSAGPVRADPAAIDAGIHEVLAAYTAGDDLAVERWLRTPDGNRSVSSVERVVANRSAPWSRASAAFLLEVAVAAGSPRARGTLFGDLALGFQPVRRTDSMLLAGAGLLARRPTPFGVDAGEDRFEVLWHQAAIGVAQGNEQYALQQRYLDAIGPRLDQASRRVLTIRTRLPLARAIAAAGLCCWGYMPDGLVLKMEPPGRAQATPETAVTLFGRAAEVPDLRVEALVRGAVLLRSVGRDSDALAWLERAPAHDDRGLGYMQHLTLGRLLDGTNRAADAASAYQLALAFAPLNQRAGIGLAAALLRAGREEDAARIAGETRRLPEDPVNHVQAFYRADARFVGEWLAEIRRLRR